MSEPGTEEFAKILTNADLSTMRKKVDHKQFEAALVPEQTKYRILDNKRVEDYSRETITPPHKDTQTVLQSTYSIAGGPTNKRFLETEGAGPCVVATLYDPSSKIGAMVHFDSRSNVEAAMKKIRQELPGDSKTWEMRIVGGHKTAESSRDIVQKLRTGSNIHEIPITEEDVLMESFERKSVSVALDTETGELFDLSENYGSTFTQEQNETIARKQHEIATDPAVMMGEIKHIGDF